MTTRVLVLVSTALAAVASLSLGTERPGPPLRATAGGAMQLESSRDGQAVLTASSLKPGESAEGSLTLTNRAAGPQRLTLSTSGLADTPGAGGGVLSSWLDLRVERDGNVVFAGKLADLPELDLGDLAAGSTTPFRFVVTLPEQGPSVDDAYAGGSVEVGWSWRADADTGPSDPGPLDFGPSDPAPSGAGSAPPAPPVDPGAPSDVEPSGAGADPVVPSPDEIEGPARPGASTVRLWLGGRSRQRLSPSLGLSAVCRPGCVLRAAAKVRVGGRWRTLGRRSLGSVAPSAVPGAVRFRLSTLQQRSLRATLGRHGALRVRISVTAAAPGHRTVTKVRSLRLLP